MIIILGANGHVGSAAANELLRLKQPVLVVLHSKAKEQIWKQKGAEVAVADINDTNTLRTIFNKGEKAFLLNPPASPSTDMETVEKNSVRSILQALEGSSIQKVVAESTYGAQPGEGIGDMAVLYMLEQGLEERNIPATIIRAAYYMSNWEMSIKTAQQEGILHTLYPIDFALPMVSPNDLGRYAAQFLMEPLSRTGVHFIEGPRLYSSKDVAVSLSLALHKPVKAVETPQAMWVEALKTIGFSDAAARSMAAMSKITLDRAYEVNSPIHGQETLQSYIQNLVNANGTNAIG